MSTIFPRWTNQLPTVLLFGGLGAVSTVIGVVWYYFTPKFWEVGYMPAQPEAGFSHLLHAGKMGLDCRYCHTHVEESPEANVPNVATCYGCHATGRLALPADQDKRVDFVRAAYESDQSIPWRRVHKLPDYVRNFPHNIHVNAGVSCYSCHGMIPNQAVVHQVEPISMAWCLDCHRNPEPNLVPRDKVTDLFWVRDQLSKPGNPKQDGSATVAGTPGGATLLKDLKDKEGDLHLLPENCGACHY